jgi:hypothetical protein
MSDEGVRHIEMTWRCSTCGHQNLGRHKECVECKHPKDASEAYEMPADPSQAASVTDADLLRMATAGPNWRCAYCGSDQRKLDGSCQNCGASAVEGKEVEEEPPPPEPVAAPAGKRRARWVWLAIAAIVGAIWFWHWNVNRPRDFTGKVGAASWEQVIDVERYHIVDHEGFRDQMPADAFEVASAGNKIHHYDDVLDGYTTEHYTVQVACGQDCTSTPRTCSEHCTSNKNGFATCRTSCTGGGRSCTTRYCSEARSRQVPHYHKEPRYQEAFRWRDWEWTRARSVRAAGQGVADLRWPVDEAKVGLGLTGGEKEREQRRSRYVVTVGYGDKKVTFDVATSEELARFAPGTEHTVHTESGRITVDGQPVTPTSAP